MNGFALKGAVILVVALATVAAASLVPVAEDEEPVATLPAEAPSTSDAPAALDCQGVWPYVDAGCLAGTGGDTPEIRVIRPGAARRAPIETADSTAVSDS